MAYILLSYNILYTYSSYSEKLATKVKQVHRGNGISCTLVDLIVNVAPPSMLVGNIVWSQLNFLDLAKCFKDTASIIIILLMKVPAMLLQSPPPHFWWQECLLGIESKFISGSFIIDTQGERDWKHDISYCIYMYQGLIELQSGERACNVHRRRNSRCYKNKFLD